MAADDWLVIEGREFLDFPRVFFVRVDDRWLFVDSRFDDAADDYGESEVFDMGDQGPDRMPHDWTNVRELAVQRLGAVQLSTASFDETRRRAVARSALASVLQ